MDQKEFQNRFADFCDKSFRWCSQKAEASVTSTTDILKILLDDAMRVSKMSQDTIDALQTLKKNLGKTPTAGEQKSQSIIKALKNLSSEHIEISEFSQPIVETLQFQDKIRQNMENLAKMLHIWFAEREKDASGITEAAGAIEFGEKLFAVTTMIQERDLVRHHIPGMPEEKAQETVMLF